MKKRSVEMGATTYAIAQIEVAAGDVEGNVQKHLRFMHQAARRGVQFLLFPELSLTGYEPALARELAMNAEDARLQPLRKFAAQNAIITVVGAPLVAGNGTDILIAALTFGADGQVRVYTKQHLHSGEEQVFTAGTGGAMLSLGSQPIALAVCADFSHATHARQAARDGAEVYAASVLISRNGYVADAQLIKGYAKEYGLVAMMANHGGATGGWQSAGRSAIWGKDGEHIAAVAGEGDCLLIATYRDGHWSAAVEPLI
jgi:predicted amidohydrolase